MFPDWKRLNWWQWFSLAIWTVIIAYDLAVRPIWVVLDVLLLMLLMMHWVKDQTIEDLRAQIAGQGKTEAE